MALVTMNELLQRAQKAHQGIGAFNVGNLEMVRGAVKAAEDTDTPIILQLAEKRMGHSPLALMGPMMVEAARKSRVEIAVHLDHGESMEVLRAALEYGFTSIMMDSSHCDFAENVRRTKEAVVLARQYGASAEAELGLVGGNEGGAEREIRFTDPEKAAEFVRETGIDCLAVAIGNAHGHYPLTPHLAFDVLAEIHEKCGDLPLVLHGGSGISDADFRKAISFGITKVNIATASFQALTNQVSEYIRQDEAHDYFGINEAMVAGTYRNVLHHIKVFQCVEPLERIN